MCVMFASVGDVDRNGKNWWSVAGSAVTDSTPMSVIWSWIHRYIKQAIPLSHIWSGHMSPLWSSPESFTSILGHLRSEDLAISPTEPGHELDTVAPGALTILWCRYRWTGGVPTPNAVEVCGNGFQYSQSLPFPHGHSHSHSRNLCTVKPIPIPVLFLKTHSHSLPFPFPPNHLQIKRFQTKPHNVCNVFPVHFTDYESQERSLNCSKRNWMHTLITIISVTI